MIGTFLGNTASELDEDVGTVRRVAGAVVRLLEHKLGHDRIAAVDRQVPGFAELAASVGGGAGGLSALGSDLAGGFRSEAGLTLLVENLDVDAGTVRAVTERLLRFLEDRGDPAAANEFRAALPDLSTLR